VAANKPVLTTKPFETDPDAALAALREAQLRGVPVHLNSPSPLPAPDLATIEQWRGMHSLGRPVGARADVWVRYHETANGTWYDDPHLCQAAPLVRLGIYLINDLVRIFGPAREVFVQHSRLFTGRPTADNAQVAIQFENGALANCFASFCVEDGDFYRNSLVLNFERGTLYRNSGPERPHPESNTTQMALVMRRPEGRAVIERSEVANASGTYQWETFARAVRGERIEGEIAPEQIVEALRVLSALNRSAEEGTVVSIKE
jgi:predicted dehydrogenase